VFSSVEFVCWLWYLFSWRMHEKAKSQRCEQDCELNGWWND
jgi:hypothetical protein